MFKLGFVYIGLKRIILFLILFLSLHTFSQSFPCDNGSRLYFFQNSATVGGSTYLSYISNFTTTPVITTLFPMPSSSHNGLAANPIDSYLYFLQGTTLMKLDAVGGTTAVCNLGFTSAYGCFDYLGRYWTINGSSLMAYNINSCTVVKGPYALTNTGFKDVVFNPRDCHLYTGNTVIDSNGVISSNTIPSFPNANTYGGAAMGSNGFIYGVATDNSGLVGTLSSINLTNNTSANTVTFSPAPSAGQSDMASFPCVFVSSQYITNQGTNNHCNPSVAFTDQSTGPVSTWNWDFGDIASGTANTSTLQNPTHVFSSPGTYTITLSVYLSTNVCYPQTHSVNKSTITISKNPQVVITSGSLACNPVATTTLIASSTSTSNITYNWSGPSILNGATTPTAIINQPGNYTISISDPSINCITSAITTITQHPLLNLDIQSTNCFGVINATATAITSNGTGSYSYLWSDNETTPNIATTAFGIYSVTATDNITGCVRTSTVNINLLPQVTVFISAPDSVCKGVNFSINAITNNAVLPITYSWSTNQTTNPINMVMQSSGNVTIFIVDSNNCTASSSKFLTKLDLPIITFTASKTIGCAPLCVNFTTNLVGKYYSWNFGDGYLSNLSNPTECYRSAGNHTVDLSFTDNYGCSNSLVINNYIYVYPIPKADFLVSLPTNNLEYTVNFVNTSVESNYFQWNFGDPNDSVFINDYNPSFTYNDYGTYTVTLIASNNYGCTDTLYKQIILIEDFSLYVPNAFTPNQNGLNDNWKPLGTGVDENNYDVTIYNRWGEKIFNTTTWGQGWDGTFKGQACANDSYIYKIITQPKNKSISYKGEYVGYVMLIK